MGRQMKILAHILATIGFAIIVSSMVIMELTDKIQLHDKLYAVHVLAYCSIGIVFIVSGIIAMANSKEKE